LQQDDQGASSVSSAVAVLFLLPVAYNSLTSEFKVVDSCSNTVANIAK
jgi:hypothetical protein